MIACSDGIGVHVKRKKTTSPVSTAPHIRAHRRNEISRGLKGKVGIVIVDAVRDASRRVHRVEEATTQHDENTTHSHRS